MQGGLSAVSFSLLMLSTVNLKVASARLSSEMHKNESIKKKNNKIKKRKKFF
jgi:hypothetical protein